MASVCTWTGDRISIQFFADSPLGETLNQGPLALLLQRQYEFPFGIDIVQLIFFKECSNLAVSVWYRRAESVFLDSGSQPKNIKDLSLNPRWFPNFVFVLFLCLHQYPQDKLIGSESSARMIFCL